MTGVTEPLEFSCMFVAPLLYGMHAVFTGLSMMPSATGSGHGRGFTFSAGAFDYALNYGKATKPLLLLVIGAVIAVIYYFLLRFAIRKWNLRTPGNEPDDAEMDESMIAV